jgi:hypothetical protein
MANPDRPSGFRPVKSLTGAPINMMLRKIQTGDRSSDTTNNHGDIYVGDPIAITSGLALPANSGDTIAGVCVGVGTADSDHGEVGMFNPSNLERRYLPLADTTGYIWYCPAEGVVFEAQTAADLDLLPGDPCDFSTDANEAHGSQTTGLSSAELVANSNGDVVVVENVEAVDNDVTIANARHLVRFTTTEFAQ